MDKIIPIEFNEINGLDSTSVKYAKYFCCIIFILFNS